MHWKHLLVLRQRKFVVKGLICVRPLMLFLKLACIKENNPSSCYTLYSVAKCIATIVVMHILTQSNMIIRHLKLILYIYQVLLQILIDLNRQIISVYKIHIFGQNYDPNYKLFKLFN